MAKKNRKHVEQPVVDPFAQQRAMIAANEALRSAGSLGCGLTAVPPIGPVAVRENPFLVRSLSVRAEAAADEAKRTAKETFIQPTRQTESQLRPDALNRMLKSGSLTTQQGWAADQIHAVYVAVLSGILSRAGSAEQRSPGKAEIHDKIAGWHSERYVPWAEYLGGYPETRDLKKVYEDGAVKTYHGRPAHHGRCVEAVSLTIDVVIDGRSLAECERERGWRRAGTAAEMLRYSLAVYAQLAGFEDSRSLIAAYEDRHRRRRVKLAA